MTYARSVAVAALVAWIGVGATALIGGADTHLRLAQWAVAFVASGALFAADLRRPSSTFLALAALAVIAQVLVLCQGFEGALLVLVALRLGGRLPRRTAVVWIIVQTALLAAAIANHWNARAAWLLAPGYFGFQLLALFVADAFEREAAANAELRALHGVIAESSRIAERLRIAHELHDALGHRLTVLTLNLESALQRNGAEAHADTARAQQIARDLLADVRAIVAEKHADSGISIATALHTLVASVPRPRIHLAVNPELRVSDPERAHILVRCAQEIVTNAARHSGGDNLWITIDREGDAFRVTAHDDGRGSDGVRAGFGLRGMRARIEKSGGELTIESIPGRGFGIVATVPLRSGT